MRFLLAQSTYDTAERIGVGAFTLGGLISLGFIILRYYRAFVETAGDELTQLREAVRELQAEVKECERRYADLAARLRLHEQEDPGF